MEFHLIQSCFHHFSQLGSVHDLFIDFFKSEIRLKCFQLRKFIRKLKNKFLNIPLSIPEELTEIWALPFQIEFKTSNQRFENN